MLDVLDQTIAESGPADRFTRAVAMTLALPGRSG